MKKNSYINYDKNMNNDSSFKRLLESVKTSIQLPKIDINKELSLKEYIKNFNNLSYFVYLGFSLIMIIFVIIINSKTEYYFELNFYASIITIIFLFLLLVFYLFFLKKRRLHTVFFLLSSFIFDAFIFFLAYNSIKNMKKFDIYIRYFYHYILGILSFAFFILNFSFLQMIIYLSYKIIVFVLIFNLNRPDDTINENFYLLDVIFLILIFVGLFIFCFIKQKILTFANEFFKKNKFAIDYFNSLINNINRAFLSINIKKFSIDSNKSFIIFIKSFGISDEKINWFLKKNLEMKEFFVKNGDEKNYDESSGKCFPKKGFDKITNGTERNFCKSFKLQDKINNKSGNSIKGKFDNKSLNSSDRAFLKNSDFVFFNHKQFNGAETNQDKENNIFKNKSPSNRIIKENSSLEKPIENYHEDNRDYKLNLIEKDESEINFMNLFNDDNDCRNEKEDIFLKKLDFLLEEIFSNFYLEEKYTKGNEEILLHDSNSNNNGQNLKENKEIKNNLNKDKDKNDETFCKKSKKNLSEIIREIFYNQSDIKNIQNKCKSLKQNFLFKGTFVSKKIIQKKNSINNKYKTINNLNNRSQTIEVYFRKIKTSNGELIEFFFNDVTSSRNIEIDKQENRLKANILAKVSHEFKTPLITIIYILKNYVKKYEYDNKDKSYKDDGLIIKNKFDKHQEEDYIANTIDLSDYMLSLINDIVDYSAISSDFDFKCEFENFELHELLVFSFRILKILINCRGMKDYIHPILEINDNVPKNFCSDEKRLKQIILNLINNSIKFTRRGYIKIAAKMNRDGMLHISIEDTGIGIQGKDIPKLFQDYSKISDKQTAGMNKIGSGLGLSICKKIIEKIGRRIDIESYPNKKTVFFFDIENKSHFQKSYSVNKSISKNMINFKKNIMNVTTSSLHKIKLSNFKNEDYLLRPKSWNTNIFLGKKFQKLSSIIIKKENEDFDVIIDDQDRAKTIKPIKIYNDNFQEIKIAKTEKINNNVKYKKNLNLSNFYKYTKNDIKLNGNTYLNKNFQTTSLNNSCINAQSNNSKNLSNSPIIISTKRSNNTLNSNNLVSNPKQSQKIIDYNNPISEGSEENEDDYKLETLIRVFSPNKSALSIPYSLKRKISKDKVNLNDYDDPGETLYYDDVEFDIPKIKKEDEFIIENNNTDHKVFLNFKREKYLNLNLDNNKLINAASTNAETQLNFKNDFYKNSHFLFKKNLQINYDQNQISYRNENIPNLKTPGTMNFNVSNSNRENYETIKATFVKNDQNFVKIIGKNELIEEGFYKLIKHIKKFYESAKQNDIILVVDDNKFLRKSLKNNIRSIFVGTSVEAIGCADGLETLFLVMIDQMLGNKIKLIISDENMVYMNGTETHDILERFLKDGKISFIPFALCSAAHNTNLENNNYNKISFILNKPPSKNELKSIFVNLGIL